MNLDRCRVLYQKFIEYNPSLHATWTAFAEFESNLAEEERSEAIYELAVQQEALDNPELMWKKYIDYEISLENREKVEELYDRLLQLAQHSKVYISYAQYVSGFDMDKARDILENGISTFKQTGEGEMRYHLLLALKSLEESIEDNAERIKKITERQPKTVNKSQLNPETGIEEDYLEYIFPDDEANSMQMAFLEMANQWKQQMEQKKTHASEEEDGERKRVKFDENIDIDDI